MWLFNLCFVQKSGYFPGGNDLYNIWIFLTHPGQLLPEIVTPESAMCQNLELKTVNDYTEIGQFLK